MKYVAVIGPKRAFENWCNDFRGVTKNAMRETMVIADVCFFSAARVERIHGLHLVSYVCVGYPGDWTYAMREAMDYAATRVGPAV